MNKTPSQLAAEIIQKAASSAAESERAARANAQARYFELVVKDKGSQADAEELVRSASLIGRDADQIVADRRLVEHARRYVAEMETFRGAKSALLAMEELRGPLGSIIQQQIDRLKAQQAGFETIVERVAERVAQFGPLHDELQNAKAKHPELLAGIVLPERTLPYAEDFSISTQGV
ncbi:MAG TPA: hypothetical protein VF624_04155 [Tepidisphaeraceae bacterium]|jgi:hypothetical protein